MIATITIFGKKSEAKGDTPLEALSKLKIVGITKAKSILTVGDRTIVLNPYQTQRLFSPSAMMRDIALKQTASRF